MKLLKTLNNDCLIQNGSILLVFDEQNVPDDLSQLNYDLSGCKAQIRMLGKNEIRIIQMDEIYRFNSQKTLLNTIELIAFGLKQNKYKVYIKEEVLRDPLSFNPSVISEAEVTIKKKKIYYQFKFKGEELKGFGPLAEGLTFEEVETLPTTLEDIFSLYVDLNKILAKAFHESKDPAFMIFDDWAKGIYS